MPHKFNHPCAYKDCPGLASPGDRFCPIHKKIETKRYNQLAKIEGKNRAYWSSARWRRIREGFLKKHPFCIVCGEAATQVDHIVPVRLGGSDDESNLQSFCIRHHSSKTAKEGRWG
jgi:5-methylcytosine-specific restriction protein A